MIFSGVSIDKLGGLVKKMSWISWWLIEDQFYKIFFLTSSEGVKVTKKSFNIPTCMDSETKHVFCFPDVKVFLKIGNGLPAWNTSKLSLQPITRLTQLLGIWRL